jgi:Protein of unknwon function (DUF3310)
MTNPNSVQYGGAHYKGEYQHWDAVADLGLDYLAGCASKYITRHRKKNGREDVQKAVHYIQKKLSLIQAGRIPAPIERPHLIQLGENELFLKFIDINGIEASLDIEFLQSTMLASSVRDYESALKIGGIILEEYDRRPPPPTTRQPELDRRPITGTVPPPTGILNFKPAVNGIPSQVAAAMEPDFQPEGYWGDMLVLWKCKNCRTYFKGADGELPSTLHQCPGAEASGAYVNQGGK